MQLLHLTRNDLQGLLSAVLCFVASFERVMMQIIRESGRKSKVAHLDTSVKRLNVKLNPLITLLILTRSVMEESREK